MNDILQSSLLYDFYGELLTEHQKEVYEDFVLNDLSLGEIAEERGISRQGVHDSIKRSNKILRAYEEKLHIVQRFNETKKLVEQICEFADKEKDDSNIKRIKAIAQELLNNY